MKKFITWIFSVALVAGLAASPMYADQLLKKNAAPNPKKATAAMQAQRAPQKSAKGKNARGLTPRRSASNGIRTEINKASHFKAKRTPNYAEGTYPEIIGSMSYSAQWEFTGEAETGLYTIPTTSYGEFELILPFDDVDATYGGAALDGVYYFNYYYDLWGFIQFFESYGYDLETGEVVYYHDNGDAPILSQGMAADPTTNTIYGIFYDETLSGLELASITYPEGNAAPQRNVIAPLADWYTAFAVGADGTFYAIQSDDFTGEGILVTLDRTTGAATVVGPTGQYPYYISGACIDARSNRMFWCISPEDESGYMVEVDLETGATTLVSEFAYGEEMTGLFVPQPAAADNAPGECTDVTAFFAADSLTGQINFTTPTTNFDGSEPEGMVDIHVLANGTELYSDTGLAAGTSDYANVTVPSAGLYTFTVYASNSYGDGPKTTIKNVWVGADSPAATTATAAYADGTMEISWLPVTEGINGGYIGDVTYTVKDMEGNILASNLTETSYSFALTAPEVITTYQYAVYVVAQGMESAPALTNAVVLGSIVPPYVADFSEGTTGWTILDANNDGKAWSVQSDGSIRMTYNSSLDMDDWLITPPLLLEAGKGYNVSFVAKAQSTTFPERLEVMWGDNNTISAMTNTLLAPTVINADYYVEYSEMLIPETSGKYYIGFHGISDADQYYLYLDDIQIEAGVSTAAPGLATNLVATPAAGGALACEVSFNAPNETMGGAALASLTSVELYRGETLINTWSNPAPGAALSFNDTEIATGGNVTYTVVGYNEDGTGLKASVTAFIGFDLPEAPAVVNITTTEVFGQVLLTWTPVTEDVNGQTLSSSDVTYTVCVYSNGWQPIAEGLTVTEYTYQAVAGGEQEFVQLAVFAETSAGVGSGTVSEMIPAGTPYDGLNETFADGELHYIWGYSQIGSASINFGTDSTFEDIASVKGDNGYIYVNANYLDYGANFFSGLISTESLQNPALTFYTYNISNGEDADINEVAVSVKEQGAEAWTILMQPTTVDELCGGVENEWAKVTVSLAGYENKIIQIQLTAITKFYTNTFFDDIKVGSLLDNDLAIIGISAPGKVKAGDDYTVQVSVSNEGVQDVMAYSVDLYANNALLTSQDCEALAAGSTATVDFNLTMSPIATEPITYYAVIVYNDEFEGNNWSADVTVIPVVSNLPKATDLEAAEDRGSVVLTWNEPNLEGGIPVEITDDFEDADGFMAEYGDWKFYDGDMSEVGGFQNMDLPGIIPGSTFGSFWIWDNDIVAGNESFEAHSGTHYLFALFRYDDGTSDDWAISPQLYGGAQEISFYAKSYSSTYPERIQVYYSTGSQDVEDFIPVEGTLVNAVPAAWTQYTASLPEGAVYFAIRSFATGSFMLMVDDVTYTPAGITANLEIEGYNVYRNGVKINETLVEETSFIDYPEVDGEYSYVVTVVYTDKGESAASNVATVNFETSGVNAIGNGGLTITTEGRTIVILNAEGLPVTVADTAGAVIYNGIGSAKTTVEAAQGIYMVKAGKTVAKVLVK